ncbi:MAG: DJ-1 family glyoxalase III [Vibrio sp.]
MSQIAEHTQALRALVPIAPGSEEMEAITLIDILIRAGFHVTTASCADDGALVMKGSRQIGLVADCALVEVADAQFDVIALPGGKPGAIQMSKHTLLLEMLRQQKYEGRLVAAICAAPALVLAQHQLYPDALMTCHPDFTDYIPPHNYRVKRVVQDINHKLITSQGPGTALEFAMEIVTHFVGKEAAWKIAEPMVPLPNLNYHQF